MHLFEINQTYNTEMSKQFDNVRFKIAWCAPGLTKCAFARRFKVFAVEQMFCNLKLQCKTRQIFQPFTLNYSLVFKFRLEIHTHPGFVF